VVMVVVKAVVVAIHMRNLIYGHSYEKSNFIRMREEILALHLILSFSRSNG
jgi:hypothetical protein